MNTIGLDRIKKGCELNVCTTKSINVESNQNIFKFKCY